MISKEPLGPFVDRSEFDWCMVAKWTPTALIEAEEKDLLRRGFCRACTSPRVACIFLSCIREHAPS